MTIVTLPRFALLIWLITNVLVLGYFFIKAPTARLDPSKYIDEAIEALTQFDGKSPEDRNWLQRIKGHIEAAKQVSEAGLTSGEHFQVGLFFLCCMNISVLGVLLFFGRH